MLAPTVGRKKGPPSETFGVRVRSSDLDTWRKAAERRRCDVADLVREATQRLAEQILAEPRPSKKHRS